ncbi:MAG: prepilin-type N-terminal cleavage/methylation domain-containing protein [Candidatus Pacebacteria bacterium]|nr:prepilin-type N-terminal cleavage/methylation domain-containing protein [Candidatus Paceibacterota bacterium]
MKKNTTQSGFTLIEVMVSVAIFSIIVTIGIGSLLSINTAHKKALANKTALDSVNFVMESIAKSIRTGDYYSCTDLNTDYDGAPGQFINAPSNTFGCDIANEVGFIQFNDSERGERVSYALDTLSNPDGAIVRKIDTGPEQPITGSDVSVDAFHVVVVGNALDDQLQPRVTIRVVFRVLVGGQEQTIAMQTTVSQRSLDAMPAQQSQSVLQQASGGGNYYSPGNTSGGTKIINNSSNTPSGNFSNSNLNQISTQIGPSPTNGSVKNP